MRKTQGPPIIRFEKVVLALLEFPHLWQGEYVDLEGCCQMLKKLGVYSKPTLTRDMHGGVGKMIEIIKLIQRRKPS